VIAGIQQVAADNPTLGFIRIALQQSKCTTIILVA
jgi:hypothetical protein